MVSPSEKRLAIGQAGWQAQALADKLSARSKLPYTLAQPLAFGRGLPKPLAQRPWIGLGRTAHLGAGPIIRSLIGQDGVAPAFRPLALVWLARMVQVPMTEGHELGQVKPSRKIDSHGNTVEISRHSGTGRRNPDPAGAVFNRDFQQLSRLKTAHTDAFHPIANMRLAILGDGGGQPSLAMVGLGRMALLTTAARHPMGLGCPTPLQRMAREFEPVREGATRTSVGLPVLSPLGGIEIQHPGDDGWPSARTGSRSPLSLPVRHLREVRHGIETLAGRGDREPNAVELSPSTCGRGVGVRVEISAICGKPAVSLGAIALTLPSPKGRGFLISTALGHEPNHKLGLGAAGGDAKLRSATLLQSGSNIAYKLPSMALDAGIRAEMTVLSANRGSVGSFVTVHSPLGARASRPLKWRPRWSRSQEKAGGSERLGSVQPDLRIAKRSAPRPSRRGIGKAVELTAAIEGRNKPVLSEVERPALAGVSGKLTGRMPETVVARAYSGLPQTLDSTALGSGGPCRNDGENQISTALSGIGQPQPRALRPSGRTPVLVQTSTVPSLPTSPVADVLTVAPTAANRLRGPLQALATVAREARIHRDGNADRMARRLQADAVTIGADVFFRHGCFEPESPKGFALLSHELTHVRQHLQGEISSHTQGSLFSEALERQAGMMEETAFREPGIHPVGASRQQGNAYYRIPSLDMHLPSALPIRGQAGQSPTSSHSAAAPTPPLRAAEAREMPGPAEASTPDASGLAAQVFRLLERKLQTDKERLGIRRR